MKRLYYVNADVYHYLIGREDQSIGIETVKNEPVMNSEAAAPQEKPVEPVFQATQLEPVPSVQPVSPASAAPRETVKAPVSESDQAAQVRAAEAEASASPSSAQAPLSDEPVMRPVPRAQLLSSGGKPRRSPAFRPMPKFSPAAARSTASWAPPPF